MVYKEIEIDSTWQQPLGEIRVIQEEADGRKLIIHLYDNGTPCLLYTSPPMDIGSIIISAL